MYSIPQDYTRLTSNCNCLLLSIFTAMRRPMLQQNLLSLYRLQIHVWNSSRRIGLTCVDKFCLDERQDIIMGCCGGGGNKLHAIFVTVGTATYSKHSWRYDLILQNRLRIGHCRITHSYLLSSDGPPTVLCYFWTSTHCPFGTHPFTGYTWKFSRSLLLRSCLKALASILLLLLSRKHIFIINVCYFNFILDP